MKKWCFVVVGSFEGTGLGRHAPPRIKRIISCIGSDTLAWFLHCYLYHALINRVIHTTYMLLSARHAHTHRQQFIAITSTLSHVIYLSLTMICLSSTTQSLQFSSVNHGV